MVQAGQITFYTHVYSPYCHRVHIALEEAKADYTSFSINLMEKPAWYAEKVNPAGKIPAITYGGPKGNPENPPPEAARINESLIILEFLNDLFPEAKLLPTDPVLRAKARLFENTWDTKGFEGFRDFFFMYAKSEGAEKTLLDGLEAVQARLPPTGFAVGEWSNADAAVGPFVVRGFMLLKNDLGTYPAGKGIKLYEELQGPKFARLRKYAEDVQERPSFKATWDEAAQLAIWSQNPMFKRN
ncbi:thioredoxin-like protein [Lenzites betulinus]|nr:thioredoxin-like protein [Lenzites betulinus]